MKRKSLVLLVIAMLVIVLLSACSSAAQNGRSHGSRAGITDAFNTDIYTYDLPENSKSFSLDLELTASQGSYAWKVTDPNGQVALDGSAAALGGANQKTNLALIPGHWTLEVSLENVTGSYDIEWRSK